jgi:futalosine hydrolase
VKLLVVTAVDAERDAVVRDLGPVTPIDVGGSAGVAVQTPAGTLHAISGGIGPVAAAVATGAALAAGAYEFAASAGIAGGFRDRARPGAIVVADRSSFADLGARTDDGFLSPPEMGLGHDPSRRVTAQPVAERISRVAVPVLVGEILTLACMTATEADAEALTRRYPHALAEAMEGFGVVEAAHHRSRIPRYVTEIRAISNVIGRRDPATWDIPAALDALALAFAVLVKEPLP